MLNLIASDLYRITRPRGLRGSFWQYLVALVAVYGAITALFVVLQTPGFGGLGGGTLTVEVTHFASPSAYLASMLGGIVPLCVCFMMVELTLADFKQGFIKSVVSARRGRLSYFAGKLLFAGVLAAIVVATASLLVLISGLVFGVTFDHGEAPLALLGWCSGFWLNIWALAAFSLVLVYATRINPVSYICAFCYCVGTIPQLILGIAHALRSMLPALAPAAPVLETLAAWMPSTALGNLSGGSTLFMNTIDVFGRAKGLIALDPGLQAILTGIIWIALASALVLAIARRRDV